MNRVRALCEHCYPSIEYPPDRTMATPANDSCVIEQAEDPWLRTTVEALLLPRNLWKSELRAEIRAV